jgi:hypothetical protein
LSIRGLSRMDCASHRIAGSREASSAGSIRSGRRAEPEEGKQNALNEELGMEVCSEQRIDLGKHSRLPPDT